MRNSRYLVPVAMALILAGAPASAQTADEHDAHHPAGTAVAQAAPQAPDSPAPAQSGMMMNRMMGQGMMGQGMMGGRGMGMMRGAGPGVGMMRRGMGTIDHVEGRIAFLKTELKVTEAQIPVWNEFAETLRANAKKLSEVRSTMMARDSAAKPQTVTERLDLEERWLVSRLDGTRATKAALASLYGVLSTEQKATADDLIAPHVGIVPMMMGMAGGMP